MINNDTQLKLIINQSLETAMNNTTKIALDELLNIIEQTVYSYSATWTNGQGGDTGRTHEFYDSWGKTKAKIVNTLKGSAVEASIMQMIPLEWHQPFSHGSIVEGRAITIEELDNIINKGISESHINFPAIEARPFWDEFEKWCNGNIKNIFRQECQKVGLNLDTSFSYSL